MRMRVGKDEWTPAMTKLLKNTGQAARTRILSLIGDEQAAVIKNGIERELQYNGQPMRSPSKHPRPDGKFAASYKWRYESQGRRHLNRGERELFEATGRVGRRGLYQGHGFVGGQLMEAVKIRSRVPVTAASKQLNFTGATKKSIELLSVDPHRSVVGPKTGHGNLVISVHNPTRRPFGISREFAEWAQHTAATEAMKGV